MANQFVSAIPGFLNLLSTDDHDGVISIRATAIVMIRGTWDANDICIGSRVTLASGHTHHVTALPVDIEEAMITFP